MIVPKYFEDFDHLHVNTMPNRAYYIPASRRMEDLVENREHIPFPGQRKYPYRVPRPDRLSRPHLFPSRISPRNPWHNPASSRPASCLFQALPLG